MERKAVTSSTVKEIGYDTETQILEVLFSSGGVYQYSGVSAEQANAFLNAESKGRHFAIHIRPCFQCTHMNAKPKGQPNAEAATETPSTTEAKAPKKARSGK